MDSGGAILAENLMSTAAPAPGPAPSQGEVTRLLIDLKDGRPGAADLLVPIVYDELHRMASRHLRGERSGHTLQATALVHEAYLKLTAGSLDDFNNRAHFFAVASQAMRQILVDSARSKHAKKRGGVAIQVELTDNLAISGDGVLAALVVNDALSKLQQLDPRQARIVEMKFFVGMTTEQIASVLGVTTRTVIRQWNFAQSWLFAELGSSG